MKYQFQVDGRRAGPVRDTWRQAAQDAVSAGMAVWNGGVGGLNSIKLDEQAAIARQAEPNDQPIKHAVLAERERCLLAVAGVLARMRQKIKAGEYTTVIYHEISQAIRKDLPNDSGHGQVRR